jgi:hypothetical protein
MPGALPRMSRGVIRAADLGDASPGQPDESRNSAGRLREKAAETGRRSHSDQQSVDTRTIETETIIIIRPVNPGDADTSDRPGSGRLLVESEPRTAVGRGREAPWAGES